MDTTRIESENQTGEWLPSIGRFLGRTSIAYFTMEIALEPRIHTYSGGLGILAGDTARSCADLELPVVFVSLISRLGYLRQDVAANGRQIEYPNPWNPAEFAKPLRAKIAVPIAKREVWIRPWLYVLRAPLGRMVPVLLLDTDLDENSPEDRSITDVLYGGDEEYRLKQEIILGIGGHRILQALGFSIRKYHLNEGHAALLPLEILRRCPRPADQLHPGELKYDISRPRAACIFTTHTPVEAGHDRFSYDVVAHLLGDYIDVEQLKLLAGPDKMNMTLLALKLSGYVNGVAQRHAETTHRMFPGYRVRAITNGVHLPTWAHERFAALYDKNFPSWRHEPEVIVRADQISNAAISSAHQSAKSDLIALLKEKTGQEFPVDVPLIGFARRMTAYKRPDLLFQNLDRLAEISKQFPFRVVMAGKAHPKDEPGKRLIQEIHERVTRLEGRLSVLFLPGYDMALAKTLVSGVDVWLNTPISPMEASGTSGMKAALNGVLNLSVLDGWWVEACIEGVTGWAIGEDGREGARLSTDSDLYDKLQSAVLPTYYNDRERWIWMMKQSISKIASYFNTHRMMRRYATEAYLG
ncbi:MAG: glycogen phosphorylase [Rhodospirillaceae bacterium]|nr:glycogen phosphorylase [Rhodospirillaceae bacterium]